MVKHRTGIRGIGGDPNCTLDSNTCECRHCRKFRKIRDKAPEMLKLIKHASDIVKFAEKFLQYQRPGKEHYPAREDSDAWLDKYAALISEIEEE